MSDKRAAVIVAVDDQCDVCLEREALYGVLFLPSRRVVCMRCVSLADQMFRRAAHLLSADPNCLQCPTASAARVGLPEADEIHASAGVPRPKA